eukprot:m.55013 g.55013  ORF g.55013 m.55013 type:complete len:337 (+) comp22010_c0_seq1:102-1112(+)
MERKTSPSVFRQGMAASFYGISSVLIMSVNKYTLTVYRFPSPAFLAMMQVIATIVILRIARMFGLVTFEIRMSEMKKVFPLPLIYLGNTVTGLAGTKAISLPMFAVLRRFSIVLTMLLEGYILGNTFNMGVKISVALMLFGALIAAMDDLAFNLAGYTWIMANNVCTAANGVIMKKKLDAKELGPFGLMFYNCVMALPIIVCVVVYEGKLDQIQHFPERDNRSFQVSFFISTIMGFVLTYSIVMCTSVNSALTTTVVGCLKNVLISYGGILIGGDYIFSWGNFAGLNISIFGSLYYSYLQTRKEQVKMVLPSTKAPSSPAVTSPGRGIADPKLQAV